MNSDYFGQNGHVILILHQHRLSRKRFTYNFIHSSGKTKCIYRKHFLRVICGNFL